MEQIGLASNAEHMPRRHWKVSLDVFDLFDVVFGWGFVVVVVVVDLDFDYCNYCRIGHYWLHDFRHGPCPLCLRLDHAPRPLLY